MKESSRTKSSGRRKEVKGGEEGGGVGGESDSSSGKVSFAGERKKNVTSVKKLKKRRGIPVAPPKLPSSDSVVLPPSLFLTSGLRHKQSNHSSDSGMLYLTVVRIPDYVLISFLCFMLQEQRMSWRI